jgi:hypothetical protein
LLQLDVLAAERIRIRDVVHAVQQEDVVEDAIAVDIDRSLETDAGEPWRTGQHAGGEQRQLRIVTAVERQLDDLPLVDHHTARRSLGFEKRRSADDFDGFADRSRLERDVDRCDLGHLQCHAGPDRFRKSGTLDRHRVVTRPQARNGIETAVVRFGFRDDIRPRVRDDDQRLRYHRAGGIPNGTRHRRGFLLAERGERDAAERDEKKSE